MESYHFNWNVIWRDWDALLGGLALGLEVAVYSLAIGMIIGQSCAFMMTAKSRLLRVPSRVYVTFLRNQPPLLLLFFAYFVLPRMGIRLGREESVILTLGLYAGAQLAEVFRGALVNIPRGIAEAGKSIGLTTFRVNLLVILPIMFRNALPALGNTFISLFKDTSLAAGIALAELTWQTRRISTETFAVMESWITACVLYVVTCTAISYALSYLENKLRIPR